MNTFDAAAGSVLSKQQSGRFTLRGFLAEVEADDPSGLCRISESVNADFNITALAMELEKAGRAPALWFQNVQNQRFSVVTNLFGSRRRYALALGVAEGRLIDTWANSGDKTIEPLLIKHGPVQDVVLTGADVDLGYLPVMKHFEQDAGAYITYAVVIAEDPDTGVRNASFHRMQVKDRTRMGTSLHSRRHLWNYVQRNDQRGRDTPIAIVIGSHPLITFGGLWKGSIEIDEYAIIGGLLGEPLEIVRGRTVPIDVPAQAEFIIEGRILVGARESEGPFAEFTGYASERSTQHVVEVTAITHRKDAIYQDIVPGISDEHTSLLAVPQEARLLRTLRQQYPNVTAVAYPKSGTCYAKGPRRG